MIVQSKETVKVSAPMITLAEAQMISSLSEPELMKLLKSGSVKGKLASGGWKVYRMSLLAYMGKEQKQNTEGPASEVDTRIGASAVEDGDTALKDELWGLKKALAEERIRFNAEHALLQEELEAHQRTRSELQSVQSELLSLQGELTAARAHVASLEARLSSVQSMPSLPMQATAKSGGLSGFLKWLFGIK